MLKWTGRVIVRSVTAQEVGGFERLTTLPAALLSLAPLLVPGVVLGVMLTMAMPALAVCLVLSFTTSMDEFVVRFLPADAQRRALALPDDPRSELHDTVLARPMRNRAKIASTYATVKADG